MCDYDYVILHGARELPRVTTMAAKSKLQEPNIPRLFSQLQRAGEDGNFENGLKISEEILSLLPDDPEAVHCKIVSLVQLNKFQDAIKLIDSAAKKKDAPQFLFEKAYCLYRLTRYAESQKLLLKLPESDAHVRELSAQILYRLEQYEAAGPAYASLVKECGEDDDFSSDRAANYAAALSLSPAVHSENLASLQSNTMEQCFNVACCYLSCGEAVKAEETLRKAEKLCRESLQEEEDYTDEEIEVELGVVRLELGFALQLQGKVKEANALFSLVLKHKPTDISHSVIASNNIIVLNGDRDVFDSKKKIKVLANEGGSKKMTKLQKLVILYNRCLFSLQTNQLDQCRELVSRLKSSHPTSELTILAETALLHREKKILACISIVDLHLKTSRNSAPLLYTVLAQLHLIEGHTEKVCQVLESIPELPKYLGAVGVIVSLYSNSGNVERALKILDESVAWWLGRRSDDKETCYSLMMESARYKLQHGRARDAAVVLEKLRSLYPADRSVVANLIAAYSRFDPKKAEDLSQTLPKSEISNSIDVDSLEQMPSFRHTRRQLQKPDVLPSSTDKPTDPIVKQKKKRKRKPHLPKNYDPAVPPDPERWIPLRERSYYRKGRRKGFSATSRGTQGTSAASAALMAQLDASRPKTVPASEVVGGACKPKDSSQSSPRAKPSVKPAASQKKKLKKGRKGGKW